MNDRAAMIEVLLPQAEGNARALLHLARLMRDDGQGERARALADRAQSLAAGEPGLRLEIAAFLASEVPDWHFRIVRDAARNAAYDAALRRAVRPGDRVLEVGAGTGLLAMMAARAGAAQVVTCEMNPPVAEAAAEIVARNGFSDRVRVIARHSDQLDAEADLGGRADVLVSEIVSSDLLGEGVLAAHERAVRELLKPGGRVIPARGRIRVALAEDTRDGTPPLSIVDGFDLSPFNRLRPTVRPGRIGDRRLALRSDVADLFAFDFALGAYCAPATSRVSLRSEGGRVTSIAQWIALEMDDVGRYENRPAPGATSCWAVLLHDLPQPLETTPGQLVHVAGAHDRLRITIWREP